MRIDFQTHPDKYKHWRLEIDGAMARLILDVDENAGLFGDYALKLNSYDLGVDIELYDAVQRLRFEHGAVKTVILTSGKENVFCAGANIRMLAGASHADKVNFCKFTNETRNTMEESGTEAGQKYLAAVNGSCAGGGYELALAADHILLVDDGRSTVSLPEVPLLAVLPGTGGLTRVVDKRKVRRDRADIFSSTEEGVRGERAVTWRLVDEVAAGSRFDAAVTARSTAMAAGSDRPDTAEGIALSPLQREFGEDHVHYSLVQVTCDRESGLATIALQGPDAPPPADVASLLATGDDYWLLRLARELDDAILHLRSNEPELGVLLFQSQGDGATVLAHDAFLETHKAHWLVREIRLYCRRVLKRIDMTSRSLIALLEPGSCFAGSLAEIAFAADRSYMADGQFEGDNRPEADMRLSALNFGAYPMSNGLSRLQTRFLGEPETIDTLRDALEQPLLAADAEDRGLITQAFDDIDWEDEIRIILEERASFSPDALTGMEANLRFAGPETMETKIFSRLTAWQNWIFQRPNAVGPEGALTRYGSGQKANFNRGRV